MEVSRLRPHNKNRVSTVSEKNEVRRDGATAQHNSGRGWREKGDAILGNICYDIKEYAESFAVSRKVWAKVSTDAFKSGKKLPALKLILGSGNEKLRLWVISDELFKEMYEAWSEAYDGDQGR